MATREVDRIRGGESTVTIRWDVVVYFARRRPPAAELMAVRRYDPTLRDKPIPAVRERLKSASKDDWTYRCSLPFREEAEQAVAGLQASSVTAVLK